MSLELILGFALILLVASYVQSIAGFAHGLIVMGSVTLLGLAPVAFTAVVISMTGFASILMALVGRRGHINEQIFLRACLGLVPMLLVGLALLHFLDHGASKTLQRILGSVILLGGGLGMIKPRPRSERAANWQDTVAGALSGILGGLFSTSGPPLIYHFYRQPDRVDVIRSTLLAVFLISSSSRIILVIWEGSFEVNMLYLSLMTLPIVALGTYLGRKFPPPFSERGMRRLAFGLLMVLGAPLMF
jgi:uncharacterized membrane protein YfcA